ncbi:MAG TPA: helix-turn-helix transcriptional regulator [Candidatus Binatia bacterium]|nr:helix-turn-helix transcriptional regulator [Candidatus Binatia bacterium]
METTDRLIRALYTLGIESDWQKYRPLALEQVCTSLGASAGAWLSHVGDSPGHGEYTVWPESLGIDRSRLLTLGFGGGDEVTVGADQSPPGCKQGAAVRYAHFDTKLVSVLLLGFAAGQKPPAGEILRTATAHMVEAGALALRQFIRRDERLSEMGRSSRGSAALVDESGIVYSASEQFRELVIGDPDKPVDRLPFSLPEEAFAGRGMFSFNSLHFRASPAGGRLYLLHARKAMPLDELSPREQEIARALSAGKTFKTVARQCGIAVSTVANHASRIYRKLGIYRREELVELIRAPAGRSVAAASPAAKAAPAK